MSYEMIWAKTGRFLELRGPIYVSVFRPYCRDAWADKHWKKVTDRIQLPELFVWVLWSSDLPYYSHRNMKYNIFTVFSQTLSISDHFRNKHSSALLHAVRLMTIHLWVYRLYILKCFHIVWSCFFELWTGGNESFMYKQVLWKRYFVNN